MSYKSIAIGIPPANVQFLNEDGTVNITWYRFLQNVWIRSGLGTPGIALNGIVIAPGSVPSFPPHGPAFWVSENDSPPSLVVVDVLTGDELGRVQIT